MPMDRDTPPKSRSNFRRFFVRGLGILLPTILTIWILATAYKFVDEKIAEPINRGVQSLVVQLSPWPQLDDQQIIDHLNLQEQAAWARADESTQRTLVQRARFRALGEWWDSWYLMDLIGLIIAIILIYIVGVLVGSYIGNRLYARGEQILKRVPVFRQVYPYVKQVTDFLFGDSDNRLRFARVVAVQYPRKGIWSLGLVTGDTMATIQRNAGTECVTVFIPSSPTPFTGYVITVAREDTIELPITIDDALRFTVSGGVIIPEGELIASGPPDPEVALEPKREQGQKID